MKNSINIFIIVPSFQNHHLIIFKPPVILIQTAKAVRTPLTMLNLVTMALIFITQS